MFSTLTRTLEEKIQCLASAIPFWPETIGPRELGKVTNLPYSTVMAQVQTIQEQCLVFEDKGRFSRIKKDYSNFELSGS
jgi:hypothetical protein